MSKHLSKYSTIFTAEVYGIQLAVKECTENQIKDRNIILCSDSRAALTAISSNRFTSKMVWNCRNSLN